MDSKPRELRILVADDDPSILATFRLSLTGKHLRRARTIDPCHALDDSQRLTGSPCESMFDVCLCRQADEAVEAVARSITEMKPFSVAFLDVRMPPGKDGIWAAEQIRSLDPRVEFVMVTAYSDVNPRNIALKVLPSHKLLYLQKPFHPLEIFQFASALGAKWWMENELQHSRMLLEDRIRERTTELIGINERLSTEIADRKRIEKALREREADLETKRSELEETNIALKILLKKMEENRREIEQKVVENIRQRISPRLEALRKHINTPGGMRHLEILETHLEEIVSPFLRNLGTRHSGFTPTEIQVADLVKAGKTSKEIAELLHISTRAVEFHRNGIRNKLGILNEKVNLRSYLQSLCS